MKKLCIVLVIIGLMAISGVASFMVTREKTREITRAKIIQGIEVVGVDEVDNGIITLKIDGDFYDYEYEYIEGFLTIQDRINNGEDISEWAEIIK